MRGPHRFYLSLGSNINPEYNLEAAIRLLRHYGDVEEISSIWESHAVGSSGPDFLNVCLAFRASAEEQDLKGEIVRSIETALGRSRSSDKNAPRTIDIDILMKDGVPVNADRWDHPFVVLPMAELEPDLLHPRSHRRLADEAIDAGRAMWIQRRPDMLWRTGDLDRD